MRRRISQEIEATEVAHKGLVQGVRTLRKQRSSDGRLLHSMDTCLSRFHWGRDGARIATLLGARWSKDGQWKSMEQIKAGIMKHDEQWLQSIGVYFLTHTQMTWVHCGAALLVPSLDFSDIVYSKSFCQQTQSSTTATHQRNRNEKQSYLPQQIEFLHVWWKLFLQRLTHAWFCQKEQQVTSETLRLLPV